MVHFIAYQIAEKLFLSWSLPSMLCPFCICSAAFSLETIHFRANKASCYLFRVLG
jgi:hypothetical protein